MALFSIRCSVVIALLIATTVSCDQNADPDFKNIMAEFVNVSRSSSIDEIISKLNTTGLFNSTNFREALINIGFVHPDFIQILSTVDLKDGSKAVDLNLFLKSLTVVSDSREIIRNTALKTINISNIATQIDAAKLLTNSDMKTMLEKQKVPVVLLSILQQFFDFNSILETVKLAPLIKYGLINQPANTTLQQMVLKNVDFGKMLKRLQLHKLFANPLLDSIWKTAGIPTGMIQILRNMDFDNLTKVVNITEIVAAISDYNEKDGLKFAKDLIDAIDFKHLSDVVDVNQLVDAVLNVSNVYKALQKRGINPNFLKALLDDINLNDALKLVDLKSILSRIISSNGTNFEDLLKILNTIDFSKLLPDIKLKDILKLPTIAKALNSSGIDGDLIVTIVESVDLNKALKSIDLTGISIMDFFNVTKLLDKIIKQTNFDTLLKSVDLDKLFTHPLVAKFVQKQFNMSPELIKIFLKSVNIDALVKAVNFKDVSERIVALIGSNNHQIIKRIAAMLNFDKLLRVIDFKKFLENKSVVDLLRKAKVDPVILEFLATIGIDNILKSIDIGAIIQQTLISNGTFSMAGLMKQIMQNVDLTKLMRGIDWKKVINGVKTGELTSSFLSIDCLQDLAGIASMNFTSTDIDKLVEKPELKMIDAMGKPSSRFLLGNVYWMGAFEECNDIPTAKYCLSRFTIANKFTGLYGACVPKQCSADDVKKLMDILFSMTSMFGQPGLIKLAEKGGKTEEPVVCAATPEYTTGFSITLVICVIFITLCLLGTFVEYFRDYLNESLQTKTVVKTKPTLEFQDLSTSQMDLTPPDENAQHTDVQIEDDTSNEKREHAVVTFLSCFSIRKNIIAVLSTDSPKGSILSINGIRTLSMFWVIIGYLYMISMRLPVDNIKTVSKLLNNYAFLAITNADVSVDSFFFLSGLLVSYLSLKRMDKTNGKINIPMFYVHRFLRITPVYMFVILLWTNVMPHLITGPTKVLNTSSQYTSLCEDSWWANLLYINNFYPRNRMCLPWSWYLANDMQFYILAPAILYLIYVFERRMRNSRYRSFGAFLIIGVLCLLSVIITAAIIGGYDLPTVGSETMIPGNPRREQGNDSGAMLYRKPYTRITPYLVGILLGYIFSRGLTFQHRRKTIINLIGWVVAILVGYACVYGPWKTYKENPTFFTDGEQVMYGAFFRLAWALSVAWVVYACENKAGGFINLFLSWKVWIPLGRLTFCAYLIHPFISTHYFGGKDNPSHYQDTITTYEVISVTFVTYCCAFVLSIFMEQPIANVEKMLFKK